MQTTWIWCFWYANDELGTYYYYDVIMVIPYEGAIAFSRSQYGPGTVYLEILHCAGSEDALVNCIRRPFGEISSNCLNEQKAASVVCRKG